MDTSLFQTIINIIGACGTISFFWYAWIVEVLYKQLLIQNAVQWVGARATVQPITFQLLDFSEKIEVL